MPIYEYECTKCGKHHEIMQKITEKPLTECTECGGKMRKMISNTSFVLKGTGWYATDYAAAKPAAADSKAGNKTDTDTNTGGKPENKPEGKAETKPDKKSPAEAAAS